MNSDLRLCRDVAQPGRAHAWGAWGRRFKSSHPDQIFLNIEFLKVENRKFTFVAHSLKYFSQPSLICCIRR